LSDQPPEEDLTAGIFASNLYRASRPAKKVFLPWHLPRKHFVRVKQWQLQIEKLLDEAPPEDKTLRYLGLPGDDLLDLRFFHQTICAPRRLTLRFLGFNQGAAPRDDAQTEADLSLDEVKKLSGIDPASNVVWDDICKIYKTDSVAFERAQDLGPYDVVNLDLCDGFGKHAPGAHDATHYNAVARLLAMQARRQRAWLLLLTTRAGRQHIHADMVDRVKNKYASNLTGCADFREESNDRFSISDAHSLNEAIATSGGLLTVYLVGLCKWLLGLAITQNPPTDVEVKSVIGYTVESGAGSLDLVSLAIRFQPLTTTTDDPMGLANLGGQAVHECQLATAALKRLDKRVDADLVLAEDAALAGKLTAAMADLLTLARYDPDAYLHWVADRAS